jgi:hypothetical protein
VSECEVTGLELLRPSSSSSSDNDGNSRQPPLAMSLAEELEACLCILPQTPLIRTKPKLRKSKTPLIVLSLRWSGRLAAKPRASNPTIQAQNALMQKLGVANAAQSLDPEAFYRYQAIFAAPLSASKHE